MTERLLEIGWRRTEKCISRKKSTPHRDLQAIRLYPPDSKDYFIEFLNLPRKDQKKAKLWIPLQLADGWYGLPSFRFMGLTSLNRMQTSKGLEYASPPMMALANLLSHPKLGTARIESGDMQGILRSAKDLGRVLALAWLAGREEVAGWQKLWRIGLQKCFRNEWKKLARQCGRGLHELISDEDALKQAHALTNIGLLSGKGVTIEMLRITAERLIQDVIEPMKRSAGKEK